MAANLAASALSTTGVNNEYPKHAGDPCCKRGHPKECGQPWEMPSLPPRRHLRTGFDRVCPVHERAASDSHRVAHLHRGRG
jgi:hypothetical protein